MQRLKIPNQHTIKRILVACRGETAIRICQEISDLGLTPIAVYSFNDRYALHRLRATESCQIGIEEQQALPYENINFLVSAAKSCQADAIHPGDSPLAANAVFAQRCRQEGFAFIGHSSEIISSADNSQLVKEIAQTYSISLFEEYQIKKKVNVSVFGIGFKSVEVPVLGDDSGRVIIFQEQDCSIQKNDCTVVEITPAFGISVSTRKKLHDFSYKIATVMGWHQFGAVRFLIGGNGEIFFCGFRFGIRKADRITEVISGVNIIRSQLLLAKGLLLKDMNLDLQRIGTANGFSIFCRILAVDPENNFQPDCGVISACNFPGGDGVLFMEDNVYPGKEIGSGIEESYLTGVAVSAKTFRGVVDRLVAFIRECRIYGVGTNLKFLENILQHESFLKGTFTLDYIDKHPELVKPEPEKEAVGSVLKYLAEVKVNGHPETGKWPKPKTMPPKVPEYNSLGQFPTGFKDMLREERRVGLSRYISERNHIFFSDTTFRDAQQSLFATRMRTADMLAVSESYARNLPEIFSMEVWGGGTFEAALRFLHENPWERLARLRKSMPNMLLKMTLGGTTLLGYQIQPEKIIHKFLDTAYEEGIDIFNVFDTFNSQDAMSSAIRYIEKHTEALAEATIGYAGDLLSENSPYNLQFYLDKAKRLEDMGAHLISVNDGCGLMKPNEADILISALKEHISIPVSLHTHDISGRQLFTCMKAIEAGVNIVDTAVAGLSGSLSQPDLNTLLALLKDSGREISLNLEKLNEFSDYWIQVRQLYRPFESQVVSTDADRFKIPGSQYGNLRFQAERMGIGSRFQEVKQRYGEVGMLLGGSSYAGAAQKAIGDLALYMVVNRLDSNEILQETNKKSYPLSLIELLTGKAGIPPNGFPKELQAVVLKDSSPSGAYYIPKMAEVDMEKDFNRFQKLYRDCCFMDYLSYKMLPESFDYFYKNRSLYKDISMLPTSAFFYPLETDEAVVMETGNGKMLHIRLTFVGRPDVSGMRSVFFERNGYSRCVKVKDFSLLPQKKTHLKASSDDSEIGSPLPGRLNALFVREGEAVSTGMPLFVVEAMKMETTVKAPFCGTISRIVLPVGTDLEQNDLVMCLC